MQQIDLQRIIKSGLIHLYVLGLASDEERQRVEKWIIDFPELGPIIEQTRAGLSAHMQARLSEACVPADQPANE